MFEQADKPAELAKLRQQQTEHAILIARYRQLLQWPDAVYADPVFYLSVDAPLPGYRHMTEVRHLLLNDALSKARAGDFLPMMILLDEDAAFWRKVLDSHATLVSDMFAIKYIQEDTAWASALLSGPGFDAVGYSAYWQRALLPLTDRQRDLSQTLRLEALFGSKVVDEVQQAINHEPSAFKRFRYKLLFKPQATLNRGMAETMEVISLAAAPASQFEFRAAGLERAALEARKKGSYCIPDNYCLYNMAGQVSLEIDPTDWAAYIGRVFDLDAYIRMVGLQHQLQQQKVSEQGAPAIISNYVLAFNPYTEKPFDWNVRTQQLSFTPHGNWPRGLGDHPWTSAPVILAQAK